jgi:hypothetical protein
MIKHLGRALRSPLQPGVTYGGWLTVAPTAQTRAGRAGTKAEMIRPARGVDAPGLGARN